MSERDPPRLAHPLLDAARDELPDEKQLSTLAMKLGPLLGPGGPGGGGGGGGGASAGAGAGKGAALVKSAVAAKSGVGLGAAKTLLAVATVAALGAVGTAAVIRARSAPTVATSGLAAAPPSSLVATTAADERLVLAPPPAEPVAPNAGGNASAAGAHRASAPDDPQEEVHLLERAQDALRTSPDEALRLTAEHARKFPNGALAQEREVIAIDALMRKGNRDDARARADRFAKSWPHSTDLRRVQVLVGTP